MSFYSLSTSIETESNTVDERSQVQQIQFIDDSLKELEQKIKHVQATIKERISEIHYSERLMTYVHAQFDDQKSLNPFKILSFSFGTKPLPEPDYFNIQRGIIRNFEPAVEDKVLLNECVPSWQKTRFIETRMDCLEREINMLQDQKSNCEEEFKNLKEQQKRIYSEYLDNFQVKVKKIR